MRTPILLGMLLLAGPAAAQASHCATLPAKADVEVRAADAVIPAELTARGYVCPRGLALEGSGTASRCRQQGLALGQQREPRRACYAGLGLGPVEPLAKLGRPGIGCPGLTRLDTVVALRGRNLGWQDIALTLPPAAAVTVTELRRTGPGVDPAADPFRQDCFPHDCRLLRLTTRAGTPPRIEVTLAAPDRAAVASLMIETESRCPSSAARR